MSKLLFAGGRFGAKKSFQTYDPETKEWTTCANPPFACGASGVVEYGNVVIVAGGIGNMGNILMYYHETDSWRVEKYALKTPRSHCAAAICKNKLYVVGGQEKGGASLPTIEVFDVADGRCSYINELTVSALQGPRKNYSVVVKNDKVYIIGGEDGNGGEMSKKCTMFDITKQECVDLPELLEGRSHFATVLWHNQIVAIGGFGKIGGDPPRPVSIASVEAYSFKKNCWLNLPPMTRARDSHCAAVHNGRIYAVGGSISGRITAQYEDKRNTNTIDVYDPDEAGWFVHDDLVISRWNSRAVPLQKKKLLFVGGRFGAKYSVMNYSPSTGRFEPLSRPLKPVSYPSTVKFGNTVFVCGGMGNDANIQMYNVESDSWTLHPNLLRTPRCNAGVMIHNGELYVISGQNMKGKAVNQVEVFDVNERGVSQLSNFKMPPLSHERHDYAVVTRGKEYYIIGGTDGTEDRCKQVDAFDLDSHKRYDLPPMKEGRSRHAAVIFQDKLLVIGGLGHLSYELDPPRPTSLSTVESYDFNTKKWTSFPAMTRARDGHCAYVHDGKVWVFGGRAQDFDDVKADTMTVEYYDPADEKWHYKQDLTVSRWCSGVLEI